MIRDTLLYIHILSAIVSIGPFFVMFPVMNSMRTSESKQLSTLIFAFRFAVRLTKHAGHVLVTTGALLIWVTGWRWQDSWIVATIVLLLGALFFIARAFSPILRKMADKEYEQNRNLLVNKLQKAVWIYIGLLLVLLWLMVTKPDLW
jgi:uncharacterized membrane protein